jgi:hypothetical protein
MKTLAPVELTNKRHCEERSNPSNFGRLLLRQMANRNDVNKRIANNSLT